MTPYQHPFVPKMEKETNPTERAEMSGTVWDTAFKGNEWLNTHINKLKKSIHNLRKTVSQVNETISKMEDGIRKLREIKQRS